MSPDKKVAAVIAHADFAHDYALVWLRDYLGVDESAITTEQFLAIAYALYKGQTIKAVSKHDSWEFFVQA